MRVVEGLLHMARGLSRIGSALAVAAAFSMSAAPAAAQSWGGWGGWGGGWGHHHRDRVDAGDILAGVVILGTIAAVASAASNAGKSTRSRDYRSDRDYRDYRTDRNYDNRGYDSRPYDNAGQGRSSAIGNAIDSCATEVERGDRRIGSVDAVNRDGDGWRIQGRIGSANVPFDCSVSDTGRIRSVTVDGRAAD